MKKIIGLLLMLAFAGCSNTGVTSTPVEESKLKIRHNPIGVSSYSFWQFNKPKGEPPLEEIIDHAAAMGFDGVELLLVQMPSEEISYLNSLKKRASRLQIRHHGFRPKNPSLEKENGMLIKSILNRIQLHHGFVYGSIRLVEKAKRLLLEIEIRPRKGSRPVCSGCGNPGPGYDTLSVRRFEFVPLWGIAVFFLYAMRRVDCPRCKVKVERVPWAEGKNHLTTTYAWFLAKWAKRLSWKETADAFQTPWDNVFRSVKMAVAWGLANRNLDDITAIGIDEICWRKKGSKFLTLVYQIDNGCKRLLWIGKDRTKKTLISFFDEFGTERSSLLRFVCTDMWKPYLLVVAEKAGQALNILDRFHIMSHMNKAIDKVRAQEVRDLKAKGKKPILTHSRWCFLKRPENCTENQTTKLKELLAINMPISRRLLNIDRICVSKIPSIAINRRIA